MGADSPLLELVKRRYAVALILLEVFERRQH